MLPKVKKNIINITTIYRHSIPKSWLFMHSMFVPYERGSEK